MISHRNVIANIIQVSAFEKEFRQSRKAPGQETTSQVGLGLLPLNHIYSLVVTHYGVYSGDEIIILPKFEIGLFLSAIQNYKIKTLYVVSF
jgi:long-subunit acyl-CoA synthetase (AMP-forming)